MTMRRRKILLGGVAAGVAATVGREYATYRAEQARNAELLAYNANDPTQLLKHTFAADAKKINAGVAIQTSWATASANSLQSGDVRFVDSMQ